MDIFPLMPKNREKREAIQAIFKSEVKVYRKSPLFVFSIIIYVVSGLFLLNAVETVYALLYCFGIIFGAAIFHDCVVAHYCGKIAELKSRLKIQSEL